jgi:hypothetical protein
MRRVLLWLVFVSIFPLVLTQGIIYWQWFGSEEQGDLQSNLEVARGVGATLSAFIRDVSRQEGTIAAMIDEFAGEHRERVRSIWLVAKREYPAITAWHLTDRQGKIIASTHDNDVGRVLSSTEFGFPNHPCRAPSASFLDPMAGSSRLPDRPIGVRPTSEDNVGR